MLRPALTCSTVTQSPPQAAQPAAMTKPLAQCPDALGAGRRILLADWAKPVAAVTFDPGVDSPAVSMRQV
jgi:hypothetical protein